MVVPPPEEIEAEAAPQAADEPLEAYVLRLARSKGQAVANLGIEGTILACDTLSEVDGAALGKPVDRDDARRMLTQLSGRVHRVLTGVGWAADPRRASRTVASCPQWRPSRKACLKWSRSKGHCWTGISIAACGRERLVRAAFKTSGCRCDS